MPSLLYDLRVRDEFVPPVVNPPTQGTRLYQDTMPTEDAAWTLATAPTLSYSATQTVTGGVTALPTSTNVVHTGFATNGVVPALTSGFWRSPYMADVSSAGTAPNPFFGPMYGAKIKTSSTVVEVKMKQRSGLTGMTNASTRFPIRIKVNGQWISRRPIFVSAASIGYTPTVGAISEDVQFYLKLTFATSAAREIEIVTIAEYGGFIIPSGQTFSTPAKPKYTAVVLGDSIFGGEKHGWGNYSLSSPEGAGTYGTYSHLSSLWSYAMQTLGYDNPVNLGAGSSGYAISGDTINFTSTARLNEVKSFDPQLFVLGTGFNDLASGVSTATVKTNATTILNFVKDNSPTAIRVVFGLPTPPVLGSSAATLVAPYNAVLKAAAAATFSWFLDPANGDLYDGTGALAYDGANMLTGNTAYVSSDNTHPTQAGADFFGVKYLAPMLKLAHPATAPGDGGGVVNPPPADGTRPALRESYGPNGTHLPTVLEMPVWMGKKAPYERTAEPTLEDIMAKAKLFTAAEVKAGAILRVKPGIITGGKGAGSSSTKAMYDIGDASWETNLLICPLNGYGTTTFGGELGYRFDNIKHVSLFGFKYIKDMAVVDTNCFDFYRGWGYIPTYQATGSGNNIKHFEIVTGFNRPYTGFSVYDPARPTTTGTPGYSDVMGFRPSSGQTITNVYRHGCVSGPSIKSVRSGSHSDSLQFERNGDGPVYGYYFHTDCMDFSSSSATYLIASTYTTYRHCWSTGGPSAEIVYPRKAYSATDPDFEYVRQISASDFSKMHPDLRGGPGPLWGDYNYDGSRPSTNLFAGGGLHREVYDSYFVGSAGSGGTWDVVENTYISLAPQSSQKPLVRGAWTVDTTLVNKPKSFYWGLIGGDPTDPTFQAQMWQWPVPSGAGS